MDYDLIVIGSGPGGYLAAERAGAAGKRVLLIEKAELGGVCLNWGCIPTKSLLNSAKHYRHAAEGKPFGLEVQGLSFNLQQAMEWKRKTVAQLTGGVGFLMKKYKVDLRYGHARLGTDRTVILDGKSYRAPAVIIAAGSSPMRPPVPGIEGPKVLGSREVLEIEKLPASVAVIGGGVIGMEFASFFSSLGIPVDLIEMLDEILPMADADLASSLRKAMKPVNFHLSSRVEEIKGDTIRFRGKKGEQTIEADLILSATGRRPNLENLGLEESGIDFDRSGIKTDRYMQTNLPGVYAVGDVTGQSLLAHSAYRMAEVAVGHLLCPEQPRYGHMRNGAIPWAVYTLPEAAGCGLSETQAAERGIEYRSAVSHLAANGRFLAEHGRGVGFCKLLFEAESNRLIGTQMLGPYSSEMIHSSAAMIEAELRIDELREMIFPHPTVSEAVRDAVWSLD